MNAPRTTRPSSNLSPQAGAIAHRRSIVSFSLAARARSTAGRSADYRLGTKWNSCTVSRFLVLRNPPVAATAQRFRACPRTRVQKNAAISPRSGSRHGGDCHRGAWLEDASHAVTHTQGEVREERVERSRIDCVALSGTRSGSDWSSWACGLRKKLAVHKGFRREAWEAWTAQEGSPNAEYCKSCRFPTEDLAAR